LAHLSKNQSSETYHRIDNNMTLQVSRSSKARFPSNATYATQKT